MEHRDRIDKIIQSDRNLRLNPTNHVFLYNMSKKMRKDKKFAGQLEFLQRAIEIVEKEKLFPKILQYLTDRSEVYVNLGEKQKAVQDIVRMNELKPFCPPNPIRDYYIKYVETDILKLTSIKSAITELVSSNEIDPRIAQVLLEHADITAGLVVTVGAQGETLKDHEGRLVSQEDRLRYVETENAASKQLTEEMYNLLSCELDAVKSKLLEIGTSVDLAKFEIQNLDDSKADKMEIEEFALKISEEISENPDLKQYFDGLYNKLHSAMQEAECISAGHLELAGSTKVSIATGIAGLIPVPYAKQVASGTKALSSLVICNKTKNKATALIKLNPDPAMRQNILKQVAVRITLDERKSEIENMKTFRNIEVDAKRNSKSVLDKLKDVFVVNMDDAITRKIDLFILGYVDAKKIIWAVNTGVIRQSENVEDTIFQLIKIPNAYTYVKEKEYKKRNDLNSDVLCGF